MGVEKLVDELDLIFYHCLPRADKDGRLSKRMLDQAPTLHAVICFTAAIHEQTENSWTFKRNPRIHTIITPNYHFFFGAGWTRYQTFDDYWKVNTPFSSQDSRWQKPRREERPRMSANILSPVHILNVHFIRMYVKMSYAAD